MTREEILKEFSDQLDVIHNEKNLLIDDLMEELKENDKSCYGVLYIIINDFVANYVHIAREYKSMCETYGNLKSWVNSEDRPACEEVLDWRESHKNIA